MAISTPEWLAKRGGEVRESVMGQTWVIFLDHEPQYRVTVVPAAGKHACQVWQTNNGRRLESGSTYPTVDEAATEGLEDLRKALGW